MNLACLIGGNQTRKRVAGSKESLKFIHQHSANKTFQAAIDFATSNINDAEFDNGISNFFSNSWVFNLSSVCKKSRRLIFDGYVMTVQRLASMDISGIEAAMEVLAGHEDPVIFRKQVR
jgi:hypothetical protein